MKKNLRSEAAIKRLIKGWSIYLLRHRVKEPIITIHKLNGETLAEIDLREIIKKRKPLTGIKKQVEKIVRGGKAKKKTK